MVMGTAGTLSLLNGHVKVGAQPSVGKLASALADMTLIGVKEYHAMYRDLAHKISVGLQASGVKLVHAHNRVFGSTAFGIEDPSAYLSMLLKKKGHSVAPLFCICPTNRSRVQTGFTLHLTPHTLREVRDGKSALEIFFTDLAETQKKAREGYPAAAKLF